MLYLNARLSIYKCCNEIFTTESKMAARKGWRKCLKFHFFANSLWAQAIMVYDNLHERYHFIERRVLMNKNQVINDLCVEQLIIMAYFKIVAVKSITDNSHQMHYWKCLSHSYLTDTIYRVSVSSYFLILTMSIKSIIPWEKVGIQDGRHNIVKMSHHFTNNLWAHTLFYIYMKTSMSGIIYFRDVLWVKIRLLMLDLLSK